MAETDLIRVPIAGRVTELYSSDLRVGDMPGDRVVVGESHAERAGRAYPALRSDVDPVLSRGDRAVVAVFGGSGVGKSEVAAVLGALFTREGSPAYVLSGDNYPHRVPETNDAERLRVYRSAGLKALVREGRLRAEVTASLHQLWSRGDDASRQWVEADPAHRLYHEAGCDALDRYLGSSAEIDFDDVNRVISDFRAGNRTVAMKRQGRAPEAVWYDPVDLTEIQVLILEWTHGNSPHVAATDHSICLDSSPEASRAHRLKRARDANTATAFIELVIDIERSHLLGHRETASQIIELRERG